MNWALYFRRKLSETTVTQDKDHYPSKQEALSALQDNPLGCVTWDADDGRRMSAIYWNGKRRIQAADKKMNWFRMSETTSTATVMSPALPARQGVRGKKAKNKLTLNRKFV